MLEAAEVPAWLSSLLSEEFFTHCQIHSDSKKNEKNVFCLDCCAGICPHCSPLHPSHRFLQIRRYVYQEVIRMADAGMIDCDRIQTYIVNRAKVVFLKQRPAKAAAKDSGSLCAACPRVLNEPHLYCCVYCKVKHALRRGEELPIKHQREFPVLPSGSEDVQMTPESVLEPAGSVRTESGSSSGGGWSGKEAGQKEYSDSRVGLARSGPGPEGSYRHRRKGIPRRSPLN